MTHHAFAESLMARRRTIWVMVAALFTLVNVLGLAYAIFFREPMHGAAHLGGAFIGAIWLWWLMARRTPSAPADAQAIDPEAAERLAQLERSLGAIAEEVDRVGEGQRELVHLQQQRVKDERA
jgi:hypothetical protein